MLSISCFAATPWWIQLQIYHTLRSPCINSMLWIRYSIAKEYAEDATITFSVPLLLLCCALLPNAHLIFPQIQPPNGFNGLGNNAARLWLRLLDDTWMLPVVKPNEGEVHGESLLLNNFAKSIVSAEGQSLGRLYVNINKYTFTPNPTGGWQKYSIPGSTQLPSE